METGNSLTEMVGWGLAPYGSDFGRHTARRLEPREKGSENRNGNTKNITRQKERHRKVFCFHFFLMKFGHEGSRFQLKNVLNVLIVHEGLIFELNT